MQSRTVLFRKPIQDYTSLPQTAGDTPSGLPRVNERRIHDTDTDLQLLIPVMFENGSLFFVFIDF